jgi:hypothetical protein
MDDAVGFWVEMKPLARELSLLALRLFHTPANSVPSERSFSVRNLIQDKKRSCLSPEAADKLSHNHVLRQIIFHIPAGLHGTCAEFQCAEDPEGAESGR